MTISVGYMGTKRQLAPQIANIIDQTSKGPLLDLFAGVGAVAACFENRRNVWCNDVQMFANQVSMAFLGSKKESPDPISVSDAAYPFYQENRQLLCSKWMKYIVSESKAISLLDPKRLAECNTAFPSTATVAELAIDRAKHAVSPKTYPYKLFTITYAGTYVGLNQAIEIDSIRYAIDQLDKWSVVDSEEKRWLLLALCQVLANAATSTGHFAQALSPNENNLRFYFRQRSKCIWLEWLKAISSMSAIGKAKWRKGNMTFCQNANDLLPNLARADKRPSIIYADPPYTEDQYSRYYHLYETLLLYDYPSVSGKGRYRQDRFQSQFSLRKSVANAFEMLIFHSHALKASLVISYPNSGVLEHPIAMLSEMINCHYGKRPEVLKLKHRHSSLGASKGIESKEVTELIFTVRPQ